MTPTIRIKDTYDIVSKVEASTNLLHTINRNTLHISEPYTHTLVEIRTEGVQLKHYNFQNVINYDDNTTTLVFWNEIEQSILLKVEVGVAGLVSVDCRFGKAVIEITFLPTHIPTIIEYETLEDNPED